MNSRGRKIKITPWLKVIGWLLIVYGILEAIYIIRFGLYYYYLIISLACWVIGWQLVRKKRNIE